MKCQSIKRNTNKICRADFNRKINIQTSYIIPSNSPNSISSVAFTTIASVWSMIKTNTAREFIDGVNVENGLNTDFYTLYSSTIPYEKELWIEYANNLYKVSNIDNIDKENNIVRFRCKEKGDKTINANKR